MDNDLALGDRQLASHVFVGRLRGPTARVQAALEETIGLGGSRA